MARLCGRLGARAATPRELSGLRQGLRAALDLGALLETSEPTALLGEAQAALAEVASRCWRWTGLAEDPPATFDEGG